jgi:hypothetical protein
MIAPIYIDTAPALIESQEFISFLLKLRPDKRLLTH